MRHPHTDRQTVQHPHTGYTGETVSLDKPDPSGGDDNTCLGLIVIAMGVMFVGFCIGLSIVGTLALMGFQIQIVPIEVVPTATPLPR
jgi:hypothetical protein